VDGIEVSKTGYLCILLNAEVDVDEQSTQGFVKDMSRQKIGTDPIKKASRPVVNVMYAKHC
jgi:hypothetical protein